jgi:hypothetical protein
VLAVEDAVFGAQQVRDRVELNLPQLELSSYSLEHFRYVCRMDFVPACLVQSIDNVRFTIMWAQ